ncbi:PREDICTED: uncharacterized protein LOC104826571 [Tarenaya hassleriana]|uniref:uncharacterized protein LOC104826571 n=1 Tax=Tarenaya hassleriana TaxID=28532 RepID=UPI00053C803A|nr:PREDICTED: uncharacterized protein LOC104826571 [Tarenaya hassleriana]
MAATRTCYAQNPTSATTACRRKHSPPEFRSTHYDGGGGTESRSCCTAAELPVANSKLVMGQVKILKRGETLSEFKEKERSLDRDSSSKSTSTRRVSLDRDSTSSRHSAMRKNEASFEDIDLNLGSTGRIGPDPGTMTQQIRACRGFKIAVEGFAGALCSVSPAPSSVPIPGFLEKKSKFPCI